MSSTARQKVMTKSACFYLAAKSRKTRQSSAALKQLTRNLQVEDRQLATIKNANSFEQTAANNNRSFIELCMN